MDIIQANREALKEVKPKKPASKIDTGMSSMVKLKLLDASRKALIDKKKNSTNAYTQTDTFKTKLCKDVSIECQNDLSCPVDKSTETEIELLAIRAKDGTCELLNQSKICLLPISFVVSDHHFVLCHEHRHNSDRRSFHSNRYASFECRI